MQAQQQQALAQALLSEGTQPVSTEGRSIGGVGYAVSPMEGMAKIGQILAGNIGQNSANDKLAAALSGIGDQTSGTSQGSPMDTAIGKMPPDLQQLVRMWSMPESMGGNPRAAAELIGKFSGPTEQQKNFGTSMPAWINKETMLPGQSAFDTALGTSAAGMQPPGTMPGTPSAVGGGMPAPQIPVQGPQDLGPLPQQKPIDPGSMPMPKPTIPPPGASAFNSTLTGSQGEGAANVPLDQLAMPRSALAMPQANGVGTPPPDPRNYPSMNAYQGAMKAWEEGQKAQAQVKPAGEKTQAEDTGKNIADAQKTYNVAVAMLPRAMQRFEQLRQASTDASYGGGVSDEEAGKEFHLVNPDYARWYARTGLGQITEPKRATANQIIEQAANQGILSELGPQLAGLRGNKFLESIASSASGLNSADPPPAKINAINGLQDQYISNVRALADQRRSYGEKNVPTDLDLAKQISQHASPGTKISVIDPQGRLGRVDPGHLVDLINSGGQLR